MDLYSSLFSPESLSNFFQKFFRNMSGPPRAGHIWTDPGARFFHLQFYKKYVIIFKKGKISHENFSHEHFIKREMLITTEWKLDLLSKYFFDSHRQKIFLKLRTKISLKSASKISLENFICCQVRIFYHEEGAHYKRTEMRLTLEGLFWMRRAKNFLRRWVGIKMFPPNIIT